MTLSISEANAASTVMKWIGVPSPAGTPSAAQVLAALQLLRDKAYKTLSAGSRAEELDVAFGRFLLRLVHSDVLDSAMHSVWIHGEWRSLTSRMTTTERDAAADAVLRSSYALNPGVDEPIDPRELRWWR